VQCLGNQVDSSRINSVWSETVSRVLIFWVLLLKSFSNVLLSSTISMWKMTNSAGNFRGDPSPDQLIAHRMLLQATTASSRQTSLDQRTPRGYRGPWAEHSLMYENPWKWGDLANIECFGIPACPSVQYHSGMLSSHFCIGAWHLIRLRSYRIEPAARLRSAPNRKMFTKLVNIMQRVT
jgi:hypothetical protein